MIDKIFDVIIIGGSYAGLSAAMVLGRSMRDVLVIDGGDPCNKQTPHSHNFLTQDGKTPKEISTLALQQVKQYGTVKFHESIATHGEKKADGFEIQTQSGEAFKGKKLIFATGVKDIMPDIRGFAACWGISVVHCPYCHGYELKNQNTGVMINNEHALYYISLIHNLTKDIKILTRGKSNFDAQQSEKLESHNIEIIETEIREIEHQNGQVKQAVFADGTTIKFDAIYAPLPFKQRTDIPVHLGCELTEQGHVQIDDLCKTNIDGVYACGDNTTQFRSVAKAVASGNIAGAMINKELAEEEFTQ